VHIKRYGSLWVTALSSLVTLGLVRNVSRGTDNVAANFGASVTFHCHIMGKQESH